MIASFIAKALTWGGAALATAWSKLAFVGGIALALLGIYAVIRKSGRDAERADQLSAGITTIGKANTAAKAVDPSQQAIDHDPNNLDRP